MSVSRVSLSDASPSVWCRVFHWRDWLDISSARPGEKVGARTIVECDRCQRRFTMRILRYARGVTQTPVREIPHADS